MVSQPVLPSGLRVSVIMREMPWRWALLWLILPHLLIIAMMPLGGPPMTWALVFTVPAVLIASQMPWRPVKAMFLTALMVVLSTVYIALMFNLGPTHLRMLPSMFDDVRPLRSPEYLVGGALVLGALYAMVRYSPRVERFRSPMAWMLAILLGMGFIALENRANSATQGSYRNAPSDDAELHSSTGDTGLFSEPNGRHLVVVLVEALGVPRGGEERRLFQADWHRSEWSARYDIETGTVPYYGSTTNAELRELCDVWGDFASFDFESAGCLPATYRDAGYETLGIHGFYGDFFDRRSWYPRVGFSETWFREELDAARVSRCGGMFEGSCDADIPVRIARRLKATERPQLVYWLTLNTHLPVIEEGRMGTDQCTMGSSAWREENPHLCRLFAVHHQLADALDDMATDPNLPPTDILIVGDHVPPFFDRVSRLKFDGQNVPWLLLRHRDMD